MAPFPNHGIISMDEDEEKGKIDEEEEDEEEDIGDSRVSMTISMISIPMHCHEDVDCDENKGAEIIDFRDCK